MAMSASVEELAKSHGIVNEWCCWVPLKPAAQLGRRPHPPSGATDAMPNETQVLQAYEDAGGMPCIFSLR